MLDAKIIGIALLELLALGADAVTEQRALANDLRNSLDLFLSNDIPGILLTIQPSASMLASDVQDAVIR